MAGSLRVRGKPLLQVCAPPPSESIAIMVDGRQVVAQVWPCPVSFRTADCPVPSYANLESPPILRTQCHMGGPASIPLAESERSQDQAWTPALLVFPWQCHRACPAHCQLPSLGQRMQQPLLPEPGCKQLLVTVWGNASGWKRGDLTETTTANPPQPSIIKAPKTTNKNGLKNNYTPSFGPAWLTERACAMDENSCIEKCRKSRDNASKKACC